MKQILQSLKIGLTEVIEVPTPIVSSNSLSIKISRTLVSSGTERMLIEFGKARVINQARQQPDKVKIVLDKIKTNGIVAFDKETNSFSRKIEFIDRCIESYVF